MANQFKVGQKVVALTGTDDILCQPRIKGKIYIVEAILYCSGCGGQMINIGVKADSHITGLVCTCGNEMGHEGLHWTGSRHFAPIEEDSEEATESNESLDSILKELDIKILEPKEN